MVEVIVPWRGGCPYRERALTFVRGRYPWPVTIAEAPPGGWSKGAAVMPAIARSTADVVVVADGDVFGDGIAQAVLEVEHGAFWAVPHRGVFRLSEDSSARVLAGEQPDGLDLAERPYLGVLGGGVVVASRAILLSVPLDPRFVGWGGEDEAFGWALETMLGPPKRVKQPLWHLWHPPQERVSRARGSRENWELRLRYRKAQGHPRRMGRLLEEARDALRSAQPHGHDQAA